MGKRWTEDEKNILIEGYRNNVLPEVIAEKLNRTKTAVYRKAVDMGITNNYGMPPLEFTNAQIEKMKHDYFTLKKSPREIGESFGVSANTISRQIRKIGKTRSLKQANQIVNQKHERVLPFTELYRLYFEECLTSEELEEHFKCGYKTLVRNFKRHGIARIPRRERLKMRDEFKDTGKLFNRTADWSKSL